jgi:hypothetical protein
VSTSFFKINPADHFLVSVFSSSDAGFFLGWIDTPAGFQFFLVRLFPVIFSKQPQYF